MGEILFIPCLNEKNILAEGDTFHPSQPVCLFYS